MTPLPPTVRVGFRDIAVRVRPINHAIGEAQLGTYDGVDGVIWVSDGLDETLTVNVFLHELLHAMYDVGNADGDEEHIVTILANQMTQVWRDNPALRTYLNAIC